jgi:aspartate/methionine/tyrosine aminotransferase
MSLSERAGAIQPTLIREFRAKAGPDSLDLGIGQPDLEVPEPVRRAATDAIEQGRAPYSNNLGLPATREAVARHCGVEPGQTMITCGVQQGLAVAILGLVDPGDEVLVPDPGFPAYPNLVRAAGARPVPYPLAPDAQFALDPAAVDTRLTGRTSAIVLNSPSNPTGRIIGADPLDRLFEILDGRGVSWISDEIYEDYRYGTRTVPTPMDRAAPGQGGIKLSGLSKSMHLMGWRLGWLVGPDSWVDDLKPLHQHLVTCAPTPAQRAAVVALDRFDELFAPTLETFADRRNRAVRRARQLPGVEVVDPEGAFYLFLDVRAYTGSGVDTLDIAEAILDEVDVVLVPGSGFGEGGEGFLRIAYTRERSRLDEAFDRLEAFFENRSRQPDTQTD